MIKIKILVETSARHLHVSEEHLQVLFGEGSKLTVHKELSQPGQFASGERVKVVGPHGELSMRILGPCRKETQVEVSLTDARTIGVTAPVRESGHIKGSAACKLVGPCGEVELSEGLIAAKRHVHLTPESAEKFGVKDGEVVNVKLDTPERSLVFGDVVIRVNANYADAMHIDTDESNAAGASGEVYGEIIK